MAIVKITDATGVDFDDFTLPDPVGGTVKTHTATKWHIDYPGGSYDEYTGNGLTFDVNNDLTGGTITGFKIVDAKVTQFTITGLQIPASDLIGAANGAAFLSKALAGDDTITGGVGDDHILGFGGNDTIDGGKGADTMAGGADNDTYVVDNTGDKIDEGIGAGTDTAKIAIAGVGPFINVENYIFTGKGDWKFTGNDLGDSITGGNGKDQLTGGTGDDTLNGGKGNDTLAGGMGDDTYIVDSLKDDVKENGGEGTADTIQTSITLTLAANVEHLILTGKAAINGTGNGAANTITGNDGNNILDGGGGADTLEGGKGNDIYILSGGDDTVHEAAGQGIDTVKSSDNVDLTSAKLAAADIENITLLVGAISATGNALNNAILGNDGNNTLDGGAGNDTLTGGKGDDTYIMSAGTEKIVEVAGATGGVDTLKSDITVSMATFANVENLVLTGSDNIDGTGNTLANLITGNSGNNTLDGGAGNDTLEGGGGTDVLKGGAGNDTYLYDSKTITIDEGKSNDKSDAVQSALFDLDLGVIGAGKIENAVLLGSADLDATGNAAANTLTGNAGENRLDGGAGNDTLIGGDGNDTYVIDSAKDVVKEALNAGHDTVLSSAAVTTAFDNVEDYTFTGTGDWSVKGNALDNVITGGSGNDTIDGGAGTDTVVFQGKSTDFQIVYSEGKAFIVDLNDTDGNEGSDGLANVEHVKFSDTTLDLGTQATINGAAAKDLAGRSVSSAGDINNDGYADFIIGAPGAKGGAGAAYVVFGDADGLATTLDLSSLNGTAGFKLSGLAGDSAGWSVASAGDINKDGFDDVIVGAVTADAHGKDSGAAYVVFGHSGGYAANIDLAKLDGINGFKVSGVAEKDFAGGAVNTAGDINGDGYADFIIGADGSDSNGTNAGTSYVVFGHGGSFASNVDLSTLDGTTGFKLNGVLAFDHSGWSVSSAGDVNGDGIDDLMVGAVLAGTSGAYSGAAYVVFGHTGTFTATMNLGSLNGSNGFTLKGITQYDNAGFSVSSAGDINGDGFADLIVGAPYVDGTGTSSGSAYVVFGSANPASTFNLGSINGSNGFFIQGIQGTDYTGFSVSSAGDVNGDGLDDIIIGAPNAGSKYYGAAYVLYGQLDGYGLAVDLANLDTQQGFWIYGDKASDAAGISVSAAGDIDGDGYDDLLVGAAFADPHGSSSGAVQVIYGSGIPGLHPVAGTPEDDTLTGTEGADAIRGQRGNDTLIGLGGDDFLVGGPGDDTMKGGAGNDTYLIDSNKDVIDEGANTDLGDTVRSAMSIDLTTLGGGAVENAILLDSGALDATGNVADNVLTGNAKNNLLSGGGGDDTLIGGGDADRLHGDAGDDLIVVGDLKFLEILGGADTDTLRITGSGVTFDLAAYAGTKIQDIERIDLSNSGKDIISISAVSIAALTSGDPLILDGNLGDVAHLDLGFKLGGTQTIGGKVYDLYTAGGESILIDSDITVDSSVQLAHIDGSNGFKIVGSSFEYGFSRHMASGDFNGDGIDDVILSGFSDQSSFIVFGSSAGLPSTILTSDLLAAGSVGIGRSSGLGNQEVSSAGDFNGDGIDDFLIMGSVDKFSAPLDGNAYLVFGSSTLSGTIDLNNLSSAQGFKISKSGNNDLVSSFASAGDLNGDGYDDIIVGDVWANADKGAGYVLFGHGGQQADISVADLGANLNGSNGFAIKGVNTFFEGGVTSSAGDINGDGYDDLLISRLDNSNLAFSVVFGHSGTFAASVDPTALSGSNGFTINVTPDLGVNSVSSLGDINGDGFDDFAFGAPSAHKLNPYSSSGKGSIYVVFGHGGGFASTFDLASLNGKNGFELVGLPTSNPDIGSDLGAGLSAAGDFNGDGYADILVSASNLQHDGIGGGGAFLIYGSASGLSSSIDLAKLDPSVGFQITPASGSDWIQPVHDAGDVNGDGFDDLLVSSYATHTANGWGLTYIVYGGDYRNEITHLGTSKDDTFTGSSSPELFAGGQGNDTLNGGGGADVFQGGSGNDQIHVADNKFFRIDGGSGTDTLHLDFSGTIDFGNIDKNAATSDRGKISGIEIIDVANGQANALTFHLADILDLDVRNTNVGGVASLDNVLKIDGDAGDTLALSKADGWGAADTSTLSGYAIYTVNLVRVAVDTDIGVSLV